jgi:long-chain acyl-CoA synthetase
VGPVINEYYGATETGIVVWHNSGEALRKPGTVGRVVEAPPCASSTSRAAT